MARTCAAFFKERRVATTEKAGTLQLMRAPLCPRPLPSLPWGMGMINTRSASSEPSFLSLSLLLLPPPFGICRSSASAERRDRDIPRVAGHHEGRVAGGGQACARCRRRVCAMTDAPLSPFSILDQVYAIRCLRKVGRELLRLGGFGALCQQYKTYQLTSVK